MTEAKSYLKFVIEFFLLIGQVEYGVLALVVQALDSAIQQARVVQKMDNAIHRINRYPADKC